VVKVNWREAKTPLCLYRWIICSRKTCCLNVFNIKRFAHHHCLIMLLGIRAIGWSVRPEQAKRTILCKKLPLPLGDLHPYLIHGSLGPLSSLSPPKSESQMTSQLVQPFLQSSRTWLRDTHRLTTLLNVQQ